MSDIKCTVTLKFKKTSFTPSKGNDGRCVKCEARKICSSSFPCPCNMDEQLVIVENQVHNNDEVYIIKKP